MYNYDRFSSKVKEKMNKIIFSLSEKRMLANRGGRQCETLLRPVKASEDESFRTIFVEAFDLKNTTLRVYYYIFDF